MMWKKKTKRCPSWLLTVVDRFLWAKSPVLTNLKTDDFDTKLVDDVVAVVEACSRLSWSTS